MRRLLDIATGVALGRLTRSQQFHLAAVGLRKDGVVVSAYNDKRERTGWDHHAEARLCRKLTPYSRVAVVRLLADGKWAMARPCASCLRCLQRVGVERVYYSVGDGEYGVVVLRS